ncbi:hypothetical protein [Deinococcus pimensis]|uniref:hypothetical protein n=1 Tax=Deinococcus pimensis TaxID=309888 RepID=UPI0004877E5D|nr:hypothetical protein [Deinococcus pimensis]
MQGAIYLMQEGQLVEMREQPYDSEALLQQLLATHPHLLAGDQIDQATPRRWLLVSREAAVPDSEDSPGRWSVDHLFLDQDAIPTLIEVKRSSDTRIRREVVGQMLDYAANAVVYWPVERLRTAFEQRCANEGQDPQVLISDLLGSEDADGFWQQVKTNLQAGRIRMIFVADEIPVELRRVVEFLNQQMDPAEVLALEVKQFKSADLQALVPRVVGQTASATQRRSAGDAGGKLKEWDEARFFTDMRRQGLHVEAGIAETILQRLQERGVTVVWGEGAKTGAFYAMLYYKNARHSFFGVWTDGRIKFNFERMKHRPPFNDVEKRLEVLRQLNEIEGVNLSESAIEERPNINLRVVQDPQKLEHLLSIMDRYFTTALAAYDGEA